MSRLLAARNSNHLFIIATIHICFCKTASHAQRNKKVQEPKKRKRVGLVSCLFLSSFHFFLLILSLSRSCFLSRPSPLCLTLFISFLPPLLYHSIFSYLFPISVLAVSLHLFSCLYLSLPIPLPLSLFSLINTSLSPPFSRPVALRVTTALPRVGSRQVKTESDTGVTAGECTYISLLLTFVIG